MSSLQQSPGGGGAPMGCLKCNANAMCRNQLQRQLRERRDSSLLGPATVPRRLSTFPSLLVGANPKIGSCPGRTMGYVTPGGPGTLSAHLVKPPHAEGDAPENVISPGCGVGEQGFVMGPWLCLKV